MGGRGPATACRTQRRRAGRAGLPAGADYSAAMPPVPTSSVRGSSCRAPISRANGWCWPPPGHAAGTRLPARPSRHHDRPQGRTSRDLSLRQRPSAPCGPSVGLLRHHRSGRDESRRPARGAPGTGACTTPGDKEILRGAHTGTGGGEPPAALDVAAQDPVGGTSGHVRRGRSLVHGVDHLPHQIRWAERLRVRRRRDCRRPPGACGRRPPGAVWPTVTGLDGSWWASPSPAPWRSWRFSVFATSGRSSPWSWWPTPVTKPASVSSRSMSWGWQITVSELRSSAGSRRPDPSASPPAAPWGASCWRSARFPPSSCSSWSISPPALSTPCSCCVCLRSLRRPAAVRPGRPVC